GLGRLATDGQRIILGLAVRPLAAGTLFIGVVALVDAHARDPRQRGQRHGDGRGGLLAVVAIGVVKRAYLAALIQVVEVAVLIPVEEYPQVVRVPSFRTALQPEGVGLAGRHRGAQAQEVLQARRATATRP